MLRIAIGPTVESVPFTAGSWVAVWDTWPAPQPLREMAASPHTATSGAKAYVREWMRFTSLSCRVGWTAVMPAVRFDYAKYRTEATPSVSAASSSAAEAPTERAAPAGVATS